MLGELLKRLKGDQPQPEEDVRLLPLAAAALLLEVAWADHDIGEDELEHIRGALASQFGLSEREVAAIVEESRAAHNDSVGVYRFTRAITDAWNEEQRVKLLEALWRLALYDDELHRYEEHAIRKIADLLYVPHSRFIEAKLRAKRDGQS